MDKQKLTESGILPPLPAPAGDICVNWGTSQQSLADGFSAGQMDAHGRESWTAGLDYGMAHAPAADETTLPDLARLLGTASKEGKAVKLSPIAAGALYNALTTAPPQPATPKLPTTPEEVVAFIDGQFDSMEVIGTIEDRRYTLTVHDLLSCFQNLADFAEVAAQPVAPVGEASKAGLVTLDEALASGELQQLKSEAQALAADGANWSMDVGCMFVLAMIERIEAGAVVYPPDGTVSPFTVINLGSGAVKMGDAIHDGRLPALWFGKDGLGMGVEETMNRAAAQGETLAVITFANVEGLDVLLEVAQRIRGIAFPAAPAAGSAT